MIDRKAKRINYITSIIKLHNVVDYHILMDTSFGSALEGF